jgi:eukaryotic-like serine/threonine-protein kinase
VAQPLTTERLGRVSQLLEVALTLEPSDRASWLEGLQGEDAELRPIIAELLARSDSIDASQFLATLPKLDASGLPGDGLEPEHAPGDVVGPYQLERELGRGGMGTVWLAERIDKTLKRKVALKLPHQGLGQAQLAQRLARERDILSAFEHPNIARLYDAGVAEDGQPFLALEYVEGLPISRYADEHRLDTRQRLALFIQVCRAVSYAHARLVLHRDLKPSNILVTENGEVRLLDFGVAKLLQEGSTAETELTRIGGRALTPEYASPEQISGQPLTTASDIYSLGVVLYEMVCGQRPYKPKRDSMGALEEAVLTADAPRPSRLVTGELRRAVTGDVDTIILKMLEKSPNARFPTVNAIVDDIQRHLNGEPVLARPTSAWYRGRKFMRRHRVLVAATAAVVGAVFLGAAGALWEARLAKIQAKRAEANAAEARFTARVARASHEFLSQIFSDAMRGGESTAMRGRLDRAREVLRRVYADEPIVHANLLLELAGRYAEIGLNDREDEVMTEFRSLAEKTGDASLRATQECIDGYDAVMSGDNGAARPHVERGLALMDSAQTPLMDADFECLRADAMLSMSTGDSAHAVAQMKKLLRRLEADGLSKTRLYMSSLNSLGYVYSLGGQYAEALDLSRREEMLHETLGSDQTLGAYVGRSSEALLLFGLGRISEATAMEDGIQTDFRAANEDGKVPPAYLLGFATHLAFANDLSRAETGIEEAMRHFDASGPPGGAIASHLSLADALLRAGRVEEAAAQMVKATTLMGTSKPSPQARIRADRLQLALAEFRQDRPAVKRELDALNADFPLIPSPARQPPIPKVEVLEAQLEAARVLLAEGDLEGATRHATEALNLAQSAVLPGKGSAWVGAATLLMGRVDLTAGRSEQARSRGREASKEFSDTLPETHPLRVAAEQLAASAANQPSPGH